MVYVRVKERNLFLVDLISLNVTRQTEPITTPTQMFYKNGQPMLPLIK